MQFSINKIKPLCFEIYYKYLLYLLIKQVLQKLALRLIVCEHHGEACHASRAAWHDNLAGWPIGQTTLFERLTNL